MSSYLQNFTAILEYWQAKGFKKLHTLSLAQEEGLPPGTFPISAGFHTWIGALGDKPAGYSFKGVVIQDCVRLYDMSKVGSPYHLTAFQMAGIFHVGDWQYGIITEFAELFRSRLLPDLSLHASVPEGYAEIYAAWEAGGVVPHFHQRIRKECWWQETGVGLDRKLYQGPQTELFADLGKEQCSCGGDCAIYACDRFVEIGNAICVAHYQDSETPLPLSGIELAIGMERLNVVQNRYDTVFALEIFAPAFARARELLSGADVVVLRRIVDHLRTVCLLVRDEVYHNRVIRSKRFFYKRLVRSVISELKLFFAGDDQRVMHALATLVNDLVAGHAQLHPSLRAGPILAAILQEKQNFDKTLRLGLEFAREVVREHGTEYFVRHFPELLASNQHLRGVPGKILEQELGGVALPDHAH